jgi:hypothetical protein
MKLTPLMKTDLRQVNLVKKTRNYDIATQMSLRERKDLTMRIDKSISTSHREFGEMKFVVPRDCLLDGFVDLGATKGGVYLRDLAARDAIELRTENNRYRIVLLDPVMRIASIHGGEFFADPTEVVVRGSSLGGAMLRIGWIGLGFQLEMVFYPASEKTESVITSPVERLYLMRSRK